MSLENILKTQKRIKRLANKTIRVALTAAMLSISCGDDGTRNPASPSNNPPETWITEGPTGTISTNDVTIRWNGNDSDGSLTNFFYKMDNSAESQVSSLTTSHTFYDLSEGQHTFTVRAKDNDDLMDPTPATRTFEIATSTPIPTASAFITSTTGGTLYSNGYELYIPPGALSRDATATIGSPSSSIREITRDNAQRISLPLEVRIDASIQNGSGISVRFPIPELSEDLVGIIFQNNEYSVTRLLNAGGRLQINYEDSEQFLRVDNGLKIGEINFITWIISLLYGSQEVNLDRRGVNLSSSEKVALLIHGFGSTPDVFNSNLLPLLSEIYMNRVMTFQYPTGSEIDQNISSLESEINSLGPIPFKFDIVAHSMGGLVARGFARRNPDKIDKLVTLGTPHHGVNSYIFFERYINLALNSGGSIGSFFNHLFNPFSSGVDDAVLGSTFLRDLNSPGNVNAHYHLISGNQPDEYSELITGEDDGLVPTISAELGDLSSSLGSVVYPNAETVLSFENFAKLTK